MELFKYVFLIYALKLNNKDAQIMVLLFILRVIMKFWGKYLNRNNFKENFIYFLILENVLMNNFVSTNALMVLFCSDEQ